MAKRAGYLSPPRVMLLRVRPLIKWTSVGAADPMRRRVKDLCRVQKLAPPISHVVWPHWSVSRGVSIARRMAALVVLATQRR